MSNRDELKILDMVKTAYDAFNEKKGQDIRILKLSNLTAIADYFVIVTGNNSSQITALQDNAAKKLAEKGFKPARVEGVRNNSWILMDYEDIILHVFSDGDREFYNLDYIWKDAEIIDRNNI